MSGFPKSSRDNIQVALEKQVLIISLGAKLKIGKCKAIRDWFLANEFADLGTLLLISLCHADCLKDLWKIRMCSRSCGIFRIL